MQDKLRATIVQWLDTMSDETGRQLLDYIEFLESKHNKSTRAPTTWERLTGNVEDTLRGSKLGEAAFKGTSQVFEAAGTVVRGVAAAGKAVVDELQRLDEVPTKKPQPEDEADVADAAAAPPPADMASETASSESDERPTGAADQPAGPNDSSAHHGDAKSA